jgi:hypothetical protein
MKKNIKCNEINRLKIDPKYFEKKNQSVFDEKKSLETISLKKKLERNSLQLAKRECHLLLATLA